MRIRGYVALASLAAGLSACGGSAGPASNSESASARCGEELVGARAVEVERACWGDAFVSAKQLAQAQGWQLRVSTQSSGIGEVSTTLKRGGRDHDQLLAKPGDDLLDNIERWMAWSKHQAQLEQQSKALSTAKGISDSMKKTHELERLVSAAPPLPPHFGEQERRKHETWLRELRKALEVWQALRALSESSVVAQTRAKPEDSMRSLSVAKALSDERFRWFTVLALASPRYAPTDAHGRGRVDVPPGPVLVWSFAPKEQPYVVVVDANGHRYTVGLKKPQAFAPAERPPDVANPGPPVLPPRPLVSKDLTRLAGLGEMPDWVPEKYAEHVRAAESCEKRFDAKYEQLEKPILVANITDQTRANRLRALSDRIDAEARRACGPLRAKPQQFLAHISKQRADSLRKAIFRAASK